MSKVLSFFKTKGSSFKNFVVSKSKPILNDYKEAASDCLQHSKKRPVKTLVYCFLTGEIYLIYKV